MSLSSEVLNQEENSDDNKYHKLINAFMNICDALQKEANHKKKTIDFETEIILSESRKIIENVKEIMQNISDTSSKIALSNLGMEGPELISQKETIEIPYSIQLETVNCLKKVFRPSTEEDYESENNPVQIPEENIITGIVKKIEMNINELENFQLINSLD